MSRFQFSRISRISALFLLLLCCSLSSYASQEFDIGFRVVDADTKQALVGVTIHTEDYAKAEITDDNGYVFFDQIEYRDSLVFSYIGYESKKLTVKQILYANKFIRLAPESVDLDEIVVIGKIGRTDDPIEEIPYDVKELSQKQIQLKNPATTADALEKLGGAYIQRSQLGGGSPILRGFEANRVLLVVDGVRLNNAIYRSGHLQNAITIDNSVLDQVEVIYGPGSILYGSDALGGVVHFRTKDPELNRDKEKNHLFKLNSYGRFSSATYEKTGHMDINFGYEKWAFLSSATVSIFESLETGSNRSEEYEGFGFRPFYVQRAGVDQVVTNPNPAVLEDSGYNQIDFLQKIRFQPSDSIYFIGNFQFSTTTDVPRFDKLLDTIDRADNLKYAEWFYGPQKRLMGSVKARLLKPNPFYNKATLIASLQDIDEDRNTRRLRNLTRQRQAENVRVYTYTGDFTKFFDSGEQNMLTYGVDLNYNTVTSSVSQIDVGEGTVAFNEGLTRYPSAGSTMDTYAGYLGYRWRSADERLNFQGGARYSSVNLTLGYNRVGPIVWPEEFYEGLSITNEDLTWGFGGGYRTKDNWHLKVNIAKAFRSPNIDDFARIREKNNKVTVPNLDLQPETSINKEVTLAKSFGILNREENTGSLLRMSATGYITDLSDAIIQVDAPFREGEEEVEFINGEVLDTQKKINAETAKIRGFNLNLNYNLRDRFVIEGGINFTQGESVFSNEFVQDTLIPFSHIPPVYGNFGITYKNDKLTLEAQARFNGTKAIEDYAVSDIEANGVIDREGTSDNLESTPFFLDADGNVNYIGSRAWTVFNFYSSFQLTEKISINLAVENMFDKFYVPFSSSIAAPGRNFIITLRGEI